MSLLKILLAKFVKQCKRPILLILLAQGVSGSPAKLYNFKEGHHTLRASAIVSFDFLQLKKIRQKLIYKVGLPGTVKISKNSIQYQPGKGFYCKEGFPLKEENSIYLTSCASSKKLLTRFWRNYTFPEKLNKRLKANEFLLPKGFLLSAQDEDLWLFLDSSGLVTWEVQLLRNQEKKSRKELTLAFKAMTLKYGNWQESQSCNKYCKCYVNKNKMDNLIQCITKYNNKPYLHQVMHTSPTISTQLLLNFLTKKLYENNQ